jgi:MFS family permease
MLKENKPIWKYKDFLLLWGGQFVSYIGTEVSSIALPLIVLSLTGSPAQAGIIAGIRGLVYVLWALPAGALVDRWDRKTVMLIGNLGSGLTMGSIAIALLLHKITINNLYIASAVEGSFFVFANLARYTSFMRVVPKEKFAAATAQWSVASNIALLIGPPLGGLLYQTVGAFMAFFIDSLSYFVNLILLLFIKTSLKVIPSIDRKAIHHEIREGMVWLWKQSVLRFVTFILAGRNILESGLYLLIVVIAKEHHASSLVIGGLFACGAGGGIAGAFIAGRIHNRFRFRQLFIMATFLNFFFFSFFLLAHNNFLLALVTIAIYAVSPLFDVTASSYIASSVPDEIKGRVSSLTRLAEFGAISFGFFITGILLEFVKSTWTISILSCLLFLLFLATVFNKQLTDV